jgi:hypothetical protein
MAKWKYDLGNDAKKLRVLITEGDSSKENCIKILDQMILCCEYAEAQLTLDDREEYEYDIDTIATDCEDLKWCLEDEDEEYNEDRVNDVLNDFYDLMDSMRVWVAL